MGGRVMIEERSSNKGCICFLVVLWLLALGAIILAICWPHLFGNDNPDATSGSPGNEGPAPSIPHKILNVITSGSISGNGSRAKDVSAKSQWPASLKWIIPLTFLVGG